LDGSQSQFNSPAFGRHGIVSSDSNIVIVDLDGDISKFTPTGTPVWTRNAVAQNIRNTVDGGFILVGTLNQQAFPNYGDARISKRNSLGNAEWSQDLASPFAEDFRSVAVAADGGYVACGRTFNPDVPGFHDAPGFPDNSDVWVVKFDEAGNVLWQRAFGGNSSESGESITRALDGGVVVLCKFGEALGGVPPGGDILETKGGSDYWVIKLDSEGNLEWQRTLGGASNETPHWIEATNDGGYVLAGYTSSNDLDVAGNHGVGTSDIWVVKLESETKDTDGDGTPDYGDVCANGPEPGTACDDGNGLSALDVITADCLCAGQPDGDGDGVPDVSDVCPGGPDPGAVCNDGDPLTALDTVDSNCQCVGQPDADGDGVPDANDQCPGGPDPGQPCNDGDPFTSLDIINASCLCVGQPDADQDGNPDDGDPCPLQAGFIPGEPCDDGNPLTANDIVSAFGINCSCAGEPDDDGDGVPNEQDVCPGGPDPGQPCDDGNTLTINDTVNAQCACVGQPDGDEDGTPDSEDPCPLQAGYVPGGPCDDGDPFTANDVVSAFGVSCLCQGVPDGDGDGVPDTSDVCPGGPDPGQACDDGNALTATDTVNDACTCIGLPDNDQDGLPDVEDPCPVQAGLSPGEPCDDGNPNTVNDVVVTFGLNCLCQGEVPTSLQELNSGTLRIAPNPSSGQVTIASSMGGAAATVAIVDAYGRVVLRERLTSERQAFDLSQLAKGLYTITVQSDGGIASQRLVLEY
jgi:hypothetical protein